MKIITATTFEKARNLIKNAKKPIVFTSNDDELNRKVLEKENINVLLINLSNRKDFQKQRNAGFDSVMAREAKKKNILIAINFDEILGTSGKEKSHILARVTQNIKMCNKYKVKMIFLPEKKNAHDLKALGSVLGMPTWMFPFK